MNLDNCTHRKKSPKHKLFLCSHPRVHSPGNRVSPGMCRLCSFSDGGVRATEEREEYDATQLNIAGPGTELRVMLAGLNGTGRACDCASIASRMNRLGVAGCREKVDELSPAIVKSAEKWGLVFPDGFDPFPYARDLVFEACRRAEAAIPTSSDS